MVMAAKADWAASEMEVAVRMMEGEAGICDGAVYVMTAPEALEVADITPHAPGSQWERVQDTPLLRGSLATVALKLCAWPSWRVAEAGAAAAEVAAWGGGVTEGGGSLPGAGEWGLEVDGTGVKPPARHGADRTKTATA